MINNSIMNAVVREYNFMQRKEALTRAIEKATDIEFKNLWEIKLRQLELSREKATK
jgi:hypothetical protein